MILLLSLRGSDASGVIIVAVRMTGRIDASLCAMLQYDGGHVTNERDRLLGSDREVERPDVRREV